MPTPDLHDAELVGISRDATATALECVFREPTGRQSTLLLVGIERLRCTDFRLQNVVLELIVHGTNKTLSPDELKAQVEWISATAEGEQLATPAEVDALVERVTQGALQLIVLVPSWGAQLCAIASSLAWR